MSDLISRRAAIKAIEDLQDCYNGFSDTYDKACIIGAIEEVPPIESVKHGQWVFTEYESGDAEYCCSKCGEGVYDRPNYCPNCGARVDGINKSVESVDLGNGFSISVTKSQVDTQGRYCPECLYSPTCYGAGISKPACKAFVPRVRYVDCKDGGENDN